MRLARALEDERRRGMTSPCILPSSTPLHQISDGRAVQIAAIPTKTKRALNWRTQDRCCHAWKISSRGRFHVSCWTFVRVRRGPLALQVHRHQQGLRLQYRSCQGSRSTGGSETMYQALASEVGCGRVDGESRRFHGDPQYTLYSDCKDLNAAHQSRVRR